MPPRSRVSSMASVGSRSRSMSMMSHNARDYQSPLNPTQTTELMLTLIERHHTTPIEAVEVLSDILLDRFVEFVSKSMVVRIREGVREPGPITAIVSARSSLQVLHYQDTEFFHFLEGDSSHVACVPMSISSSEFRKLIEETLCTKIIEMPQMLSHVRVEYSTADRIWDIVRLREAQDAPDGSRHPTAKRSGNKESHGKKLDAVATEVLRDTSALSANLLVMKGKNPAFFVDEFCLMFERSQPLAALQASLDRAKQQLREYELNSRLSHAEPLALCLSSLLNVLTKPMHPGLSDDVCVVASTLIGTLVRENMTVACLPHAEAHHSTFMHLLSIQQRQVCSTAMKGLLAVFTSLTTPVRLIKALECSHFGPQVFAGRAGAVLLLATSMRESMEAFLPSDIELTLAPNRLAKFVQFDDANALPGRSPRRLHAKEMAFFSPQQGSGSMHGAAASGSSNRAREMQDLDADMISAVAVLWPGGITTIDIIIDTLDRLIGDGMDSQRLGIAEVERVIQAGLRLVEELVRITTVALRCLWFLPEDDIAKILLLGTASIGSIFRRMSSWIAALGDERDFWFSTVQCAISHVIAKALARGKRRDLYFIHHQWIIRVCVACGPSAERAILAELHRFFCVTKRFEAGSFGPQVLLQVWREVNQFASAVMSTTPSPSNARAMWESVVGATEAYVAMSQDPFNPAPQQQLATLAFLSVMNLSAVSSQVGQRVPTAEEVLESAWDGYEEYFGEIPPEVTVSEGTAVRGVSSMELALVGGSLLYVLDLLEQEKREKRWRSLGINCLTLADALISVGCPHSVGSLFVSVGVTALARAANKACEVKLLKLLCGQYESILHRWVNLRVAFGILDTIDSILALRSRQEQQVGDGEAAIEEDFPRRKDSAAPLEGAENSLGSLPAVAESQRKKPSVLDQLSRDYFGR